jgi:electron transfer flavoprotein beta subunit
VKADAATGVITVERRAEGGVQVLVSRMPALITMLEDTNVMRRGTLADALRSARAEVIKWTAADAGITDLVKCGLRGSPTVVKKVFAPSAREEKAHQIGVANRSWDQLAEDLMAEIFARNPAIEADLVRHAEGL